MPARLVWVAFALAQDKPPEYIGAEMCAACHEDISNAFARNRHAAVDKTCEACHGPGSKHAESASAADIGNPAKLAPAQVDRTCLTCHKNQPTHSGRVMAGHGRNSVSCIACHSVHKIPAPVVNCVSCHVSTRASFNRPHAHTVSFEGKPGAMSCVDCHNPHGSPWRAGLQSVSGNEPGCLRCHSDKRGPFAFEHAPVRVEGCAACHQPHGSANPRMLARPDVQLLCLECHANAGTAGGGTRSGALGGVPPAIHDLRNARFRNCTVCHSKIHGSHVNRTFLR